MKIIIILMIAFIIYRIFFLLFLSVADAKFPTIAQAVENPQELHQWLHMIDTSHTQVFHQPVFYSCFKKLFC